LVSHSAHENFSYNYIRPNIIRLVRIIELEVGTKFEHFLGYYYLLAIMPVRCNRRKCFSFHPRRHMPPVALSAHHPQLTDLAVISVAPSFSLHTYYPTLTTVICTCLSSPSSVPCLPGLTITLVPPYPRLLLFSPSRCHPTTPNTSPTLHYPNLVRCCPCHPNH
jgi:hypothetical protein